MKLKELLATGDFDCELCCKDTWESSFGFCWSKGTKLTEYGEKLFSKIMNCEFETYTSEGFGFTICLLDNDTITEEEFDYFMRANAGYIAGNEYDKIFVKEIKA